MILFDVPLPQSGLRQQFRRILRRSHFGYLQGSVWVTPDPADGIREILRETKIQADVLLIVEGRPAAGETDADIVSVAWDFDALHRRYKRYLEFLSSPLPRSARLPEWTQQEIIAWDYASQADPLLPQALVPPNYLGFEAHRRRKQLIAQLAVLTTTRSEQFHVAPAT